MFSPSQLSWWHCFSKRTINSCVYLVVTAIGLNHTWVSNKTLIPWLSHLTWFPSILHLHLCLQSIHYFVILQTLYTIYLFIYFLLIYNDFVFTLLINCSYQPFTDQDNLYPPTNQVHVWILWLFLPIVSV